MRTSEPSIGGARLWPPYAPTKNSASWSLEIRREDGFQVGQVYTYFCRIHPFMRGAFKVVGP
jgi:hypothetical protein